MSRLHILTSYMRQRGRRFRSREALEKWQNGMVMRLLRDVLPLSKHTAARFGDLGPDKWRSLPTITKTEMMAGFDDLNTVGLSLGEAMEVALKAEQTRDFSPVVNGITVGLSSGTSGHRGLFTASDAERYLWAGIVLAHHLPGSLLSWKRDRLAFFLRANSNLYETTRSRRLSFEFFDLYDPVEEHVKRLNDYRPTMLVAPPSILLVLAQEMRNQRLRIEPSRVVSVAEVLDPLDELNLRRTFRQTIHQAYQATEGFLGSTCPFGTLHLAEDVVVVQREYVGERRFHPVITDFSRRTQPIVRYLLDDVLMERKVPCLCGSPMTGLEHVEGRADDVFLVPARGSGELKPVFPDLLRRAVIINTKGIQAYGVRQIAPQSIEVYLKPAPGRNAAAAHDAVAKAIARLTETLKLEPVEVLPIDAWHREERAKLRRVVRAFRPEDL